MLSRRPRFAAAIAAVLLLQGCAVFQPHAPGRAITPWEQVNVSNAQLAEANLGIARAVIAASDSGVIPLELSNKILTAQSLIADKDRQLTRIFQTWNAVFEHERAAEVAAAAGNAALAAQDRQLAATLRAGAKGESAEIQELLAEIQKTAQELITDGLLGIKNPATQQQVLSNLNSIFSLAQQLIPQLRATGAVQ